MEYTDIIISADLNASKNRTLRKCFLFDDTNIVLSLLLIGMPEKTEMIFVSTKWKISMNVSSQ